MSWGTCYSGSNNIHFDFPAIMSDGRNYASWQPGAVINEQIRKEANITNNWDYRRYLTNNADDIIKNNQLAACDSCCSCPNYNAVSGTPDHPFLYKSCIDSSVPFGYTNSDLKNNYISDFQLQSRMVAPILTQDQLLLQKFPRAN
jgi:hypothetical protein